MKRLIVTADDFGLSEAVNEAVERGHRDGILTAASLMVAGPAASDAVRRAKAMPSLAIGLHLVVIEGPAVLPPAAIPDLVNADGQFPSGQFRLGVNYFCRPRVRRQLAAEIHSQFAAFAATGLKLDHANAHKHMHLHPTVGRLMIDIGREFALRAIRIPAEPTPSPYPLPQAEGGLECLSTLPLREGVARGVGRRALHAWTSLLRHQARRAELVATDRCFGLRWTGAMTPERVRRLAADLPDGLSELYLHPAAWRDQRLTALMPNYRHEEELAALLDPEVRATLVENGVSLLPGFAAA